MREVVMRVPAAAAEDVLDRLLPIVPRGVRERANGRHVDLCIRGDALPSDEQLRRAAGRWPYHLSRRSVPNAWRERRAADWAPELIGGRLLLRPEWAIGLPAPAAGIEIVLAESDAFGSGTHPTTVGALELLLSLAPGGSLLDLGCGSGVLGILAAQLGWEVVGAIDRDPRAIAATRVNAALNRVAIAAFVMELTATRPEPADAVTANLPRAVHESLAATLPEPMPRHAVVTGFIPAEADAVLSAYTRRGMAIDARIEVHGWVIARLTAI
jgi:ribosomal protein L11 methyltransferase